MSVDELTGVRADAERELGAESAMIFNFHLGMLADQPYPDTLLDRDGRRVTQALWGRLCRRYPAAELPVALLTATRA